MSKPVDELSARLEAYRAYLGLLARWQVGRALQGKADVSGIVQQTLWEAHCQLVVKPVDEAEVAPFLRRLLSNNLLDEVRRAFAGKRDVRRELSLEDELQSSSARMAAWLAAEETGLSERLGRQDELLRLAQALEKLPDAQREAVELHYLQGLPLADVSTRMGRTRPAVAGLLQRGLTALRESFKT